MFTGWNFTKGMKLTISSTIKVKKKINILLLGTEYSVTSKDKSILQLELFTIPEISTSSMSLELIGICDRLYLFWILNENCISQLVLENNSFCFFIFTIWENSKEAYEGVTAQMWEKWIILELRFFPSWNITLTVIFVTLNSLISRRTLPSFDIM